MLPKDFTQKIEHPASSFVNIYHPENMSGNIERKKNSRELKAVNCALSSSIFHMRRITSTHHFASKPKNVPASVRRRCGLETENYPKLGCDGNQTYFTNIVLSSRKMNSVKS